MSKKDNRTRAFMVVIYPDDKRFGEQLLMCTGIGKYAYICHDQDKDSGGQKLKEHYHIVLYYNDKKSLEQVSNDIGLPIEKIESYNSLDTALLYLIHKNQPDKFQYKFDKVKGPLKVKLKRILTRLNCDDENDKASLILNYISSSQDYITFMGLMNWCCENGLFDTLRRGQSLFINLIKEHNLYV